MGGKYKKASEMHHGRKAVGGAADPLTVERKRALKLQQQEEASELVLVDESAWSGCVPPPSDLGYEQVETGPTSNFVGNHMTQAAVDVVQYQLGKRDLEYERKKHMKYQQT